MLLRLLRLWKGQIEINHIFRHIVHIFAQIDLLRSKYLYLFCAVMDGCGSIHIATTCICMNRLFADYNR